MLPIFSIITPSYNQGEYIEQCIQSVISQEGDFCIDYIIMDGGSTDKTLSVIRKYEDLLAGGKWPVKCRGIKYRWMSEKDAGQSDAINRGFQIAEGTLFAWLNSDDSYLPGALEKVATRMAADPGAGVVYGKTYFIDDNGAVLGEVETGSTDYRGLAVLNLICQPSAFFRKAAWNETGGLNGDLRYAMDYDLWIRIAKKDYHFIYLEEHLATYRLHENSKTMSPGHALEYHHEIVNVVKRYFGWVPANRIYVYSYFLLKAKWPALSASRLLLIGLTLPFSIMMYFYLNKTIRMRDLRLITSNLMKIRTFFLKSGSVIFRSF